MSKDRKKDKGVFGIDWNGDGKVDLADDFITMDLMEGGGGKGCALFLVAFPVQILWALLKSKGVF